MADAVRASALGDLAVILRARISIRSLQKVSQRPTDVKIL
jgi:hypothetical protein